MIGRSFGIALAVVLLITGACGKQEPLPKPKKPRVAVAPPPPPAAPVAAAPAPAPTAPPDAANGKTLYVTNCASCHGPTGAGDGPAGAGLVPKPAHHNDGGYMNALSNDHIFAVIKGGGPAVGKSAMMAPWGGVLNDQQIWDVIAYVRSLAQPPYGGTIP
jgi:mono/diheme cytochrome c family protein